MSWTLLCLVEVSSFRSSQFCLSAFQRVIADMWARSGGGEEGRVAMRFGLVVVDDYCGLRLTGSCLGS